MDRNEFLNRLREALENDLSGPAVQEHIAYYDDYIRSEMASGKSEQEVLDMLGDPWVIARTIIDSAENAAEYGNRAGGAYQTYDAEKGRYEEEEKQKVQNPYARLLGLNTWWKKLFFLLGIVLVIVVILSVITGLIAFTMRFLLPLLAILLFVKWISRRR